MVLSPSKMCVIYNLASGSSRTAHRLAALRRTWAKQAAFRPTAAPGQAEDLALEAARSGLATVAAAGGDGTVNEVVNGLLRSQPDPPACRNAGGRPHGRRIILYKCRWRARLGD